MPRPPSRDLPDPGIEPEALMSPALAGRFFTTSATWEAPQESLACIKFSECGSICPVGLRLLICADSNVCVVFFFPLDSSIQ